MAIESIASVKSHFQSGDRPTQVEFENFIDTVGRVTPLAIASAAEGGKTGFYEILGDGDVTARSTGSFGLTFLAVAATASGRTALGIVSAASEALTQDTASSALASWGANDITVQLVDAASTASAQGALGINTTYPATDGTAGQVIKTDGAGVASFSDPMTYESQTATTSGTSVTLADDLTGLSTATDVEILLNGVSTNTANQPPILRIGPSSGVVSSGYISNVFGVIGGAVAEEEDTDGIYTMRPTNHAAADEVTGCIKMRRWDSSEHLWIVEGWAMIGDGTEIYRCHSFITLAGALADISLTTPGGTATFDAGEARVRYG